MADRNSDFDKIGRKDAEKYLKSEIFCQFCSWAAIVIVMFSALTGILTLMRYSHVLTSLDWTTTEKVALVAAATIGTVLMLVANIWPRRKTLEKAILIAMAPGATRPKSKIFSIFYSGVVASRLNLLSVVIGVLSLCALIQYDFISFMFGFFFIAVIQIFNLITTFRSSRGYLGGNMYEAVELVEYLEKIRREGGDPPFTGVASKYFHASLSKGTQIRQAFAEGR